MIATAVVLVYLRHLNFRWTRLQIAGAVGYVGSQLFFIMATKLTTAANAIFLQYTSPIYALTLEPILNPLWVFLVIGEAPGQLALVGSVLVLGAVNCSRNHQFKYDTR